MTSKGALAQQSSMLRPFRRLALRLLQQIAHGTLHIADDFGRATVGRGTPTISVRVARPRFYRRLVLGGAVGAAESYIDGDWDCDDLVGLFRVLLVNRGAIERIDGANALITRLVE